MKKYFLILLTFLAACSVMNGTENNIPTVVPGVINIIVAQTAAAASTQTAILIHPSQTSSPISSPNATATVTPTTTPIFEFSLPSILSTPTDEGSCPFSTPYYVRVRPFAVGSKNWNLYIPNYPQDGPHGYPATLFLRHVLNQDAWTLDIEAIALPNYWIDAMSKINGQGWQYLFAPSDGTFFGRDTLDVDTFPGNLLLVTNRKYRHGECWDSISAYPYVDKYNSVPDLTSLPPYQLGLQTGMNYSTPNVVYPAPNNNGNIYVPILSKHGNLWVEDFSIEPFPDLPMQITVTANTLNMTSSIDLKNSTMIETVTSGTHLTLTDYSPVQRNTFGQVTDPATGKSGYVALYNWTAWMTGSYTTTWTMQTLPVPPG